MLGCSLRVTLFVISKPPCWTKLNLDLTLIVPATVTLKVTAVVLAQIVAVVVWQPWALEGNLLTLKALQPQALALPRPLSCHQPRSFICGARFLPNDLNSNANEGGSFSSVQQHSPPALLLGATAAASRTLPRSRLQLRCRPSSLGHLLRAWRCVHRPKNHESI